MFLINGKPGETINIQDRGLQYGDGLFETLAVINESPLCLDRHLQRLQHGCQVLNLPLPDLSILNEEIKHVCQGVNKGILKIIITRGSGGRGYAIPEATEVSRIIGNYPWSEHHHDNVDKGIKLYLCKNRLSINSQLAGIKHLNRIEQVMARSEWQDPEFAEGLVMDINDHLIEGTMSNLFIIKNNYLITPDLSHCGVEGIMRNLILEHAQDVQLQAKIEAMDINAVLDANEVFVCNSIIGIWPVKMIEDRIYSDWPKTEKILSVLVSNNLIVQ